MNRKQAIISEISNRAADCIEEHGWCQGTIMDAEGRLCMVGALMKAGVDARGSGEVLWAWESKLNFDPPEWNDEEGRTKEEVIEFLRSF